MIPVPRHMWQLAASSMLACGSSHLAGPAPAQRSPEAILATSVAPSSALTPEAPKLGTLSLSPWQQCGMEGGRLRCRIREPGKGTVSWTQLVANVTSWQLEVGDSDPMVTQFDGQREAGCAVAGGAIYCWADSASPIRVQGAERMKSVARSYSHACGLDEDGAVWCWGKNDVGQLGKPGNARTHAERVEVPRATRILVAGAGTCAVLATGKVSCWGGVKGAIAPADPRYPFSAPKVENPAEPQEVPGFKHLREIVFVGGPRVRLPHPAASLCAVHDDGTVSCVGRDLQKPIDKPSPLLKPTQVEGLRGVATLVAGSDHVCALQKGGTVACWGGNYAGQLGNGLRSQSSPVMPVVSLGAALALTAERNFTCALKLGNEVHCWGEDLAYRTLTEHDRPRIPSRVRPEPSPARAPSIDCNTDAIELDLAAWESSLKAVGKDEARRGELLNRLGLAGVPPDHSGEWEEDLTPYELESVSIERIPIISVQTPDLIVQASYASGSGRASFRAQIFGVQGANRVCPRLERPIVLDDEIHLECARDTVGLSKKPLGHLSFLPVLEADRSLVVLEKLTAGPCNSAGEISWTRTFQRPEGGKLSEELGILKQVINAPDYQAAIGLPLVTRLDSKFPRLSAALAAPAASRP